MRAGTSAGPVLEPEDPQRADTADIRKTTEQASADVAFKQGVRTMRSAQLRRGAGNPAFRLVSGGRL